MRLTLFQQIITFTQETNTIDNANPMNVLAMMVKETTKSHKLPQPSLLLSCLIRLDLYQRECTCHHRSCSFGRRSCSFDRGSKLYQQRHS
jgi:hypothetical protein